MQRTDSAVLQFVGELLEFEQRLDAREEFFRKDRFVEEIVGAGFNAAEAILAVAQSGNENDGDEAGRRIFFQLTAKIVAGFAGHDDVEQDEIREARGGFRFRLPRRGGRWRRR